MVKCKPVFAFKTLGITAQGQPWRRRVHKEGLAKHVLHHDAVKRTPLVLMEDVSARLGGAESSSMVLKDVSLELRQGELHMLVGANGCGKVRACSSRATHAHTRTSAYL